jgi:preprotein translocase subunit SecG
MTTLVLVIHLLSCFILILVILLQSGKSGDLAGAFGVSGSQTTFGPRGGASILSRATTAAAIIFMMTSLGLSFMTSGKTGGTSIMDRKGASKAKPGAATQIPAAAPKPVATPAAGAATAPTAADLPGGRTIDMANKPAGVEKVQVKQLSPEEYNAMLEKDKAKSGQKPPAEKPKP